MLCGGVEENEVLGLGTGKRAKIYLSRKWLLITTKAVALSDRCFRAIGSVQNAGQRSANSRLNLTHNEGISFCAEIATCNG